MLPRFLGLDEAVGEQPVGGTFRNAQSDVLRDA